VLCKILCSYHLIVLLHTCWLWALSAFSDELVLLCACMCLCTMAGWSPRVYVKGKGHTLDSEGIVQVWHALSRDFTVLPAHPLVSRRMEWIIPAFAFPAKAGPRLLTQEGWKAELALQLLAVQAVALHWATGAQGSVELSGCSLRCKPLSHWVIDVTSYADNRGKHEGMFAPCDTTHVKMEKPCQPTDEHVMADDSAASVSNRHVGMVSSSDAGLPPLMAVMPPAKRPR